MRILSHSPLDSFRNTWLKWWWDGWCCRLRSSPIYLWIMHSLTFLPIIFATWQLQYFPSQYILSPVKIWSQCNTYMLIIGILCEHSVLSPDPYLITILPYWVLRPRPHLILLTCITTYFLHICYYSLTAHNNSYISKYSEYLHMTDHSNIGIYGFLLLSTLHIYRNCALETLSKTPQSWPQ